MAETEVSTNIPSGHYVSTYILTNPKTKDRISCHTNMYVVGLYIALHYNETPAGQLALATAKSVNKAALKTITKATADGFVLESFETENWLEAQARVEQHGAS